jgi:hypothetical protein
MLTLHFGTARDCSGLSRRNFLRAGFLGLGGLSLPWLLRNRAAAAQAGPSFVKDKAVVLIFLGGGASHIETSTRTWTGRSRRAASPARSRRRSPA